MGPPTAAQRPSRDIAGGVHIRPAISFEEPLRGYVDQRGDGSDRAPREVPFDTAREHLACPVYVEDLEGYGNRVCIGVDAAENRGVAVIAEGGRPLSSAGCLRVSVACRHRLRPEWHVAPGIIKGLQRHHARGMMPNAKEASSTLPGRAVSTVTLRLPVSFSPIATLT